jgi:uncharacterized protein (TIGR03663 family)
MSLSSSSTPAISLSEQSWRAALLYLAAAAVLLRLFELDLKPFHHDEGVNGHFLLDLVRAPHTYRYDPANYHGPTLYYLAWASSALFGLTTFSLRLVPAVCGLLTLALMLPLRRHLGDIGTLAAMALLTLSPGAVFHSRYFIHEGILVCATLGLVVGALDYLRGNSIRGMLVAALSAAVMAATKETWFISIGVLVCAVIGTVVWCRVPIKSVTSLRPSVRVIAAGLAVFVGINLLFYSSFFTNPQGPWDFFRAYNVWSNTGVVAHRGPWFRYLRWLSQMELPLLAGGLTGAILAAWRRDNAFAVFTGLWAVGIVAAYSLIPYKTPWLTLNFLPPLALSAGYLVSTLARINVSAGRLLLPVLGAVVLVVTTFQTVKLNFLRYDDDRQPYVYAQTSREVLALVDAVGDLVSRTPKRVPVVVMVPSQFQFPLPWYLRDVAAGYTGKVEPLEEGLAIVIERQVPEASRVLGERFVRVGIYELRTGTRLVLFASSSLVPKT